MEKGGLLGIWFWIGLGSVTSLYERWSLLACAWGGMGFRVFKTWCERPEGGIWIRMMVGDSVVFSRLNENIMEVSNSFAIQMLN